MLEHGFLYFNDLEKFLLFKTSKWNFEIICLQNYQPNLGQMKTLVCHDMKDGYLDYDRHVFFNIQI